MTKQRLREYRHLAKEVKQVQNKVDKLRAKCEGGAIIITDMPKGGIPPDYRVELADVVRTLDRLLSRLHCEMIAVEEFISSIPDSRTRQIFSYRYIDGMAWRQIGYLMKYDTSHIRRLHDIYIKKSL